MSISVTPNPAIVGQDVSVAWADKRARRVRFLWADGTTSPDKLLGKSGSGTFTQKVLVKGDSTFQLRGGGAILGSAMLRATEPVPVPPPSGFVVTGYGDKVTGGDAEKAHPMIVRTAADIKAALAVKAVRYILMNASAGVVDCLGDVFSIEYGDLTLSGAGWPGSIKRGWFSGKAADPSGLRNVKIEQMRVRPGDQVDAVGDCDAFSFNAAKGPIEGILLRNNSGMWGSDIGGETYLAEWKTKRIIRNVTSMFNINGPGLKQSAHDEGAVDHAKTANVTSLPSGEIKYLTDFSGVIGCDRLTFFRNLYFGAKERSPQIHWATLVDLINCVTYNWWGVAAVEGSPRGLNIVGHVAVAGPETTSGNSKHLFNLDLKPNQTKPFPNSVYIEDPLTIGFPYANAGRMSEAQSSVPVGGQPLSVPRSLILPSAQVLEAVLAEVGPTIRDSVDASLIAAVRNRTNTVYNGAGFPPPNPSWA